MAPRKAKKNNTKGEPKKAKKVDPRPKLTVDQLSILMDALEANPELYNTRHTKNLSFEVLDYWMDLAERLNASFGGAHFVNLADWRHILCYWCENTKKKRSKKAKPPKNNPKLSRQEARTIVRLEKRLHVFMETEDAKETETYEVSGLNNGDGLKFVLKLDDQIPSSRNENAPRAFRKKTIIFHEDDIADLAQLTKRFRIVSDYVEGEDQPALANQLNELRGVSRDLELHISMLQNRIQVIKDMWKQRCGDN